MSQSMTSVDVVMPVHNRRETTLQALRSLSRINKESLDVHVIVVDDGSSDNTSSAIRQEFPDVTIIEGDGTLHYAAGTNRGISAAIKKEADYILACNDDSIFHEQFLQRMISTARRKPRSIVGALLLLWNEPHRTFQTRFKWQTLKGGWQQDDNSTVFEFDKEPFEVEGLAGNCVLIPAAAVRECGLMDEKRFPYGWGDIQYFVRMRRAGWQLLIDPKAFVWCEPNTNPAPLRTRSVGEVLKILFCDARHPLNLRRQFVARWESAPSRTAAISAYILYLFRLAGKAIASIAVPHRDRLSDIRWSKYTI